MLEEHHGMPTGAFSADECFGGREPTRGVELCTVVETAFSLNVMTRYQGEGAFANRAEKIVYNALPGGLTEGAIVRCSKNEMKLLRLSDAMVVPLS